MVARTFYAAKAMRHPIYRTRMLQAGDVVEMSGPLGPAFLKMGILTDKAPRRAKAETAEAPNLNHKTKAELAKLAGLTATEAKKLTKADIIAKIEG
jgi:DNA uptake protein ComE-like DNA-binding protein